MGSIQSQQIRGGGGVTLIFSFVGYTTQEIPVGISNTVNVTMQEDASALEEVVVTALGIRREKRALGYSQQSVTGETLNNSLETNIATAVAGKISGVQFVGAPSIGFNASKIRLRGNTNVLYVVNGVKVNNSDGINNDDIADMSILKGSAATALYGPDGRNGVVIITTKQSKNGQSDIKLSIGTSIENVNLLPEFQNEYGGGYTQKFNTFSFDITKHDPSWAVFDGDLYPNYSADESWGPRLDGTPVRHWDSWIVGDSEFGKKRAWSPNSNNVKDFYRAGNTRNVNLTYLKGGEEYRTKITLSNVKRKSILENSWRDQTQIGIDASLNLTQKVKAYVNINFQDRDTQNFPDEGYGNLGANFNQWWQRQLDIDRLRNYRRNSQIVSWNIQGPINSKPLYWDSPFFELYENINTQARKSVYGKLGLQYDINEDLNLIVEAKRDFYTRLYKDRTGWGGLDTPSYSEAELTRSRNEYTTLLNYSKTINKFDIDAIFGAEQSILERTALGASSVGGLTNENYYSLNTSVDKPTVGSAVLEEESVAAFLKASLGYNRFLYIDGSYRLDWKSTAKISDNQVATLGISTSLVFSEFFDNNDILTFGKLRAGYSQAPSFPSAYSLGETYSIGDTYGSYGLLSIPSRLNNTDLVGGTRNEIEFGAEIELFQSRIGFDITYFKKVDDELPTFVSVSGTTGYTGGYQNSAKQTYKGWELGMYLNPVRTDDINWAVDINFATLERFVNKIADGVDNIVLSSLSERWGGTSLQERVGEEWGAIYGRKVQRDNQGRQILSSSGDILYDSNEYLGKYLPDFTGGLFSTISYKDFDLSVGFDFQKGGKYFSISQMFINSSGLGIATVGNNSIGNPKRDPVLDTSGSTVDAVLVGNADSKSGGTLVEGVDETTGEAVSYLVNTQDHWGGQFGFGEQFLYDRSYVRLRSLSLNYNVPSKFTENSFIKSAQIGIYGNNLWLIYSAIPNIDPSELESPSNNLAFLEGGQLPSSRSMGLNIKLTF